MRKLLEALAALVFLAGLVFVGLVVCRLALDLAVWVLASDAPVLSRMSVAGVILCVVGLIASASVQDTRS